MSDTIRYGIIGTGMMGHEHIRNLALVDGAEVAAFADPHPKSRWWARQLVGDGPLEFSDHRDLLRQAAIDAVVIASPNHTHRAVLDDVLETDLPVLVEKPLCTTVEDALHVAERAESRNGLVWVGMEYRFMAPVARLIAEVHGGTAGRVRMLSIREHRFPFLPKVGNWNRFARNTGGTFVEKCCHFFDLMRLILASEPVRVYATGAQDVNHLDECFEGEVPDVRDNGFVVVDFDSGARALLDLCMFAEGSRHEQEVCATGDAGKVECFIPESSVVIGDRRTRQVRTEGIPVDESIRLAGSHHGSTFVEHQRLRAAILGGSPPEVSARDGLLAVAMGAAAERSIAQGRPVELSELL
jgi:predicted dehydrogenase